MKIITDHKWKPFRYRYEVPDKVLTNDLDYLDDAETNGYFCYRNNWYHLSEFVPSSMKRWDGVYGITYLSSVAIKVSEDGEHYRIATIIY